MKGNNPNFSTTCKSNLIANRPTKKLIPSPTIKCKWVKCWRELGSDTKVISLYMPAAKMIGAPRRKENRVAEI